MSNPVLFVSLGPGDPELVTLKALKALQQADVVFCPAAGEGSRAVGNGLEAGESTSRTIGGGSRAAAILSALEIAPEKVRLFPVPMSGDRRAAVEAYRRTAEDIAEIWRVGLRVAVAAEGDAGFYATTDYIAESLAAAGVVSSRIAGVPAFLACGALAGIPVVRLDEVLEVVPGTLSAEALGAKLSEGRTVVVMKASRCEATLKQAVGSLSQTEAEFHYFENAGIPGKEFYSSDREVIAARPFPYFSLVIIRHP